MSEKKIEISETLVTRMADPRVSDLHRRIAANEAQEEILRNEVQKPGMLKTIWKSPVVRTALVAAAALAAGTYLVPGAIEWAATPSPYLEPAGRLLSDAATGVGSFVSENTGKVSDFVASTYNDLPEKTQGALMVGGGLVGAAGIWKAGEWLRNKMFPKPSPETEQRFAELRTQRQALMEELRSGQTAVSQNTNERPQQTQAQLQTAITATTPESARPPQEYLTEKNLSKVQNNAKKRGFEIIQNPNRFQDNIGEYCSAVGKKINERQCYVVYVDLKGKFTERKLSIDLLTPTNPAAARIKEELSPGEPLAS